MNDVAAVIPTEGTLAIALPKVLEAFACRTHGKGLGREHQGLGARGKPADGCPVGVFVKAGKVFEGTAVRSQEPSVTFDCESIDHGSEMLVWYVLHVECKVRRPSNSKIRSYASTVLRKGGDEQAHWSGHRMRLLGPYTPGSSTTGWAWVHHRH